jgi:hypothetical protein
MLHLHPAFDDFYYALRPETLLVLAAGSFDGRVVVSSNKSKGEGRYD